MHSFQFMSTLEVSTILQTATSFLSFYTFYIPSINLFKCHQLFPLIFRNVLQPVVIIPINISVGFKHKTYHNNRFRKIQFVPLIF